MQVFETRKNFQLGPPPRLLRREGPMHAQNPNWICVEGSEARTIRDAVVAFARSSSPQKSESHEVALVRHHSGLHGLFFSPQLNPWVFANLVAWLADQRIVEGGSGACGWTHAGRGGRHLFQADRTNPSEDTVVILGPRGERFELYLPDGSLCPTSKVAMPIMEPALDGETVELLANFSVPLETDRGTGNPNFLVTRPANFDWAKLD
jgi:hypothetical protein